MILKMSQRDRGTARERTTDATPGTMPRGGDRRRARERSAARDAIADRIVAQYGVDRDRAVASAELYMRQLRRGRALAGY